MVVITQIKPQKNKKRVSIYLDGKFGFGIDLDNFVKLGLKVEQEFSEEEIATIVKKAEFQKTLDKLLRFATIRPRSVKEIKDWFRKHKVHESLHKQLFNRLKHLDLSDDKKFAEWWVTQRLQFKYKSKREIVFELHNKGIDKEIIDKVTTVIRINEVEAAKKLLEKKAYRWKNLEPRIKRQKMSEFLARKGFGWETINKVIKDFS